MNNKPDLEYLTLDFDVDGATEEEILDRVDEELTHYGMPRRSGRYRWGSGKDPFQRSGDFMARVDELVGSGMSEKQIADAIGLTTSQLRIQKSLAKEERRSVEVAKAKALREKGYSLNDIAKEMGFNNDSSVRSLLNVDVEARQKKALATANMLKKELEEKRMIDIGTGVERELDISKEKLNTAVEILKMEGYHVYGGGVSQINNPGKQTNLKVLARPDVEHKEIFDYKNIKSIQKYASTDEGNDYQTFKYPKSLDTKRMQICYAEDGGIQKDGVIELRRGVKDLDLGGSVYAQVRILADDKYYLKGMAVYSDDLPKGVDVRFNTNKTKDVPMEKVLKPIKEGDNPFGSLIKQNGQSYYTDENGKKQMSLINKKSDEGDWADWSDKLSSQFLSKQNLSLIKRQLNETTKDKRKEFDEIMAMTNPTVRKKLLESFADDCDSSAVHLKATSLPGQKYNVILPVNSLKDNEVYAPNYPDGTQLALVRFPHGGLFEIPILTVNNKNQEGQKILSKNPTDGVGINHRVAEQLSGADFDGDFVLTLPTNKNGVKISNKPPLKELEGFDPKMQYPERKGMKYMDKGNVQREMGQISNLITDMTIQGASDAELARAVKHSMVVIDAEKHKLNYKQSYIDNGIASLKKDYQARVDPETGRIRTSANTLISRASREKSVNKRQGSPIIDPETGKKSFKDADDLTYEKKKVLKDGTIKIETVVKKQKSTEMYEADDAYSLVSASRNPKELAYAEYANTMKALGNEARKAMMATEDVLHTREARERYIEEVHSLNSKLNVSLKNAPRERQAQTLANSVVQAKKQEYPDLTKAELKKIGQQALTSARNQVGAKRQPIEVTEKEWEAIQKGAISPSKLSQILNHADMDTIKKLSSPKETKELPASKVSHIKALKANGYTTTQIAAKLGVSATTINKYL